MFPLSQKSLVRTRVRFKDCQRSEVTLFPLFRSDGKVEHVLLLDHQAELVYCLVWSVNLFFKPLFGSIQCASRLKGRVALSEEAAYDLTKYWHFDPWWLLAEAPFAEQETTPPLRMTNCVDEMTDVTSLLFARNLSRVSMALRVPERGEAQWVSYTPDLLPARTESAQKPVPASSDGKQLKGGWRLRPFWEKSRAR